MAKTQKQNNNKLDHFSKRNENKFKLIARPLYRRVEGYKLIIAVKKKTYRDREGGGDGKIVSGSVYNLL